MSSLPREYLVELESYLRAKKIKSHREKNTLILRLSSEEDEIPIVIEMDELTNITRISIPTEIEIETSQQQKILEKNFYLWGAKLAIDPEGFLVIITEIPTDVVLEKTKEWLLNNIVSNLQSTYKNLKKLTKTISLTSESNQNQPSWRDVQ